MIIITIIMHDVEIVANGKQKLFPQWKRRVTSWGGIPRSIKKLFAVAINDVL